MYLSTEQERVARIADRARAACAAPAAEVERYSREAAERLERIRTNQLPESPATEVDTGDAFELDRRRCRRFPLTSEICVRRIGGFNYDVRLDNVSTTGCRIELIEAAEKGEAMIARFPQLEPLGAAICWTKGTTAGVAFDRPIHGAVLNALLARL